VLELVLAPFLNRLCAVFPPEVSGLVTFMIGLSGGIAGLLSLLGPHAAPMLPADWIVGIVTLGTMIALNVWGKGPASMFCALIGLVEGYIASGLTGLIDSHSVSAVAKAPWTGLPVINFERSFDLAVAAPFVIGSIAAAMKAAGTITICQKMNDADWVRPDMKSIVAGVLADGASTLLAGTAGAFGTNTSTPAVGIAAATGVASRKMTFAVATIFILMGFLPKRAPPQASMATCGRQFFEEDCHLRPAEIDAQHRPVLLIDAVDGEDSFRRIDAYALILGHGRLRLSR
jgi:xanthine permease XanP